MTPGWKDPAMRQLEVRLKPWESRRLRQLRDHATSARVVKRAMCLLLSAVGTRAVDVARITGLSLDGVSDIRRRWRRRRLRSLPDRPRSGRPPRVTTAYRRELRRALRRGPRACGRFIFTVWSIARLGTYLRRRIRIGIATARLRQLVHEEGFVIGRPAHTLEGRRDERAYRKARHRLDRLKKGRCERTHPTSCGTPTPRSSNSCRTSCNAGCNRVGN
jgi:transposase